VPLASKLLLLFCALSKPPNGLGPDWENQIDLIAAERNYKNRDTINVTKEGLGDLYDAKLKTFFQE